MVEESDRKCREHEETQKAKEEGEEEATDAAVGDGEGGKGNSGTRFQIARQIQKS